MAITHDTGGSASISTTLSQNLTLSSGASGILVVQIATSKTTGSYASASIVTYNSVGLTKVRADQYSYISWNSNTEIWYLLNPPSGTNTLAVTLANAASNGVVFWDNFFNVDQVSPIDANTGTGNNYGSPLSYSITTVANNAAILTVCMLGPAGGTMTIPTGYSSSSATSDPLDAYKLGNAAGSNSILWTYAGSPGTWSSTAISLKPALVGGVLFHNSMTGGSIRRMM